MSRGARVASVLGLAAWLGAAGGVGAQVPAHGGMSMGEKPGAITRGEGRGVSGRSKDAR